MGAWNYLTLFCCCGCVSFSTVSDRTGCDCGKQKVRPVSRTRACELVCFSYVLVPEVGRILAAYLIGFRVSSPRPGYRGEFLLLDEYIAIW